MPPKYNDVAPAPRAEAAATSAQPAPAGGLVGKRELLQWASVSRRA